MASEDLSCLSSLKGEDGPLYVQPHYKESYRLAIYALLCGGKEAYEEFLRAEQISHLLSDDEILYILENAELSVEDEEENGGKREVTEEAKLSTYFPTESDEEVPDLDMGWPEVSLEGAETSISLLFHPPRENTPSIKDVVRKQIQEARLVVAIAMDVFTDVDIFKEVISATLRGVVVYILLDQAHYRSFLHMAHRVGINIQDFKNIRVRIVEGQLYQCQSGMKFSGGLQQKFILVDCRTVLYGTYSYTWSFEKINLSMVLVVTGQLVGSYDEEFRRLYARSTVPPVQSDGMSVQYLRDAMTLQHQASGNQLPVMMNVRSRVIHGMRSAAHHDDPRLANVMTRGRSVQERLHQSHHCMEMSNLVRGHSYGGELQKLNSMTRLRMGTKDIPMSPDRTGFNMRPGGGDLQQPTNRMSQHHLRHMSRYGQDQNLIPFNSETSLHRWKMDAYFNEDMDASCDALSPMGSPYSSHTGLNEYQTQHIHNRAREMKSRVEEMRQKRLSLQEYTNLRHSQEALRSVYQIPDRLIGVSSLRNLDIRQSMADLEPSAQNGYGPEPAGETHNQGVKREREQTLNNGQRSVSHSNIPDRKAPLAYDWREPLSKTKSAADLDVKLNDPSLKLAHLQPAGIPHPRTMESLTEIPEEKEGSRVNSSDSAFKAGHEETAKDEKAATSVPPAESQPQDQARGRLGSAGRGAGSSGSSAPRERRKSAPNEVQTAPKVPSSAPDPQHAGANATGRRKSSSSNEVQSAPKVPNSAPDSQQAVANAKERRKSSSSEVQTAPKITNPAPESQHVVAKARERTKSTSSEVTIPNSPSAESSHAAEAKSPTDKGQAQAEDPNFKRKNSLRKKVKSLLSSDDKKSKKEEKSFQRTASLRKHSSRSDSSSKAAEAEPSAKKGPSQSTSSSQNSLSPSDTAKNKSPFLRLSPQRLSKKKMNASAEQSSGSSSTLTLDRDEPAIPPQRGKVYSRFEYFLNVDSLPQDKPVRLTSMNPSEKDRSASLNRNDHTMHHTQNGTDNKLGRFMQRVGSLINKNK